MSPATVVEVLVPCENVGLGTDTATILSDTGDELRLVGVKSITLVNRVAHVRLRALDRDGLRALIELPRLGRVWVKTNDTAA